MDRREAILERHGLLSAFPAQKVGRATPAAIERADKIVAGHVFFYRRTAVKVGRKHIDWSGGQIAHQEWRAQLNRFHFLTTLAAAYHGTKDESYAESARGYIEDWMDFGGRYEAADELHPGDNTLNMSIRLGTSVQAGWGGTLPVFLQSPSFDDAFLERMLASVSWQGDFLLRHLSPRGNWRIAHLDALVFTALRFPFLENASRLLEAGTSGMRNALATQFLPDGVHIERTPGYARWMTQVLANYMRLADLFPDADAGAQPETLLKALDYLAQSELFGVNDSTAPHRDPERLGNLEKRRSILEETGLGGKAPAEPPLEQVFSAAGQVFIRSAWEPGADHLAFDASTWGGAHSHLSRLSFAFRSGGRVLVADPGILNYEMSDPRAPYGKSTRAHSTLSVNGRNQSDTDAKLLRTHITAEAAFIHASYQGGYWEGEFYWGFRDGRGGGVFGDHERILFWVRGEYILVLDRMATEKGASIHNCWQLGPMEGWQEDQEQLSWRSRNDDVNLLLRLLAAPEGAEMDCLEGSTAPIRGWVGWHGNDAAPAPHVEFRYPCRGRSVVSAVLLCPFEGDEPPAYAPAGHRDTCGGYLHHLALDLPDGRSDIVAWSSDLEPPVDDGEPFVTDGTFIWLRLDSEGEPIKSFVIDGSYLEYDGRTLYGEKARRTGMVRF